MAISLVWRTDVHLSDHTPRSRKDEWTDTVLGKLERVGEIARDLGAAAVLDGGDFFDIKSPTRNSHALVRRAIEVHRKYPCPTYGNVGNHDCVYGDYTFLPQQPLGVLFESGAFRKCFDDHEVVFTEDFTSEDVMETGPRLRVRVVGVPYHGTKYDLDRFRAIKKGDEDYLVVIAHLLASSSGGMLFDSEDVVRYSDLDEFDGDVFCFGHWHKDQGIVQTPGGKTVVNVGSLTRGSLSQDDRERIPSVVHLRFDVNGLSAKKIPVPHAPAEEIFDLAKRDMVEMRENMIEDFVGQIQTILAGSSGRSVRDSLREMKDIPPEVREHALLYIEKAGG